MRKLLALAMMALIALTMAFAAVGCGQKAEESSTTETTPPVESSMPDTSSMMADTTVMDTTAH